MISRTDATTGRTVRQLTDLPEGASVNYFRMPKHLPGGLIIAHGKHKGGNLLAIEPESGEVELLPYDVNWLRLRESDGRLWFLQQGRGLWMVDLPHGEPQLVQELPEDVPGSVIDITCDGATIITAVNRELAENPAPVPHTRDADALWAWNAQPKSGTMYAYTLADGKLTQINDAPKWSYQHIDTSPADPCLLKFAPVSMDSDFQRIWAVRTDGTGLRKIRPQAPFEMVMHEWWWPNGQYIAYKYQDRRGDDTYFTVPWMEYSKVPTQLGMADTAGREVYLSDPLNHYHSHIYVSQAGDWVCGEGTDGHDFVYVAPFSMDSTTVDFTALASIHTPYHPFAGNQVNAAFSSDARWLLYNDTVEGKLQIFAVQVEV